MNVCHTGGSKHWLFRSCHYRRVLLIHLAANDDCSALPPLFCCQNHGRGWPHNSFVGCATKGSGFWFRWPRFPGKGRWKATQVNGWRAESLLGRWWIYHPAAVGRLVLLKAWNFRGRCLRKWAPLGEDEWSLRFAVAFPSTHCLRVYPSYLSGFAKNRKIIPEDSEE